MDIEVLLTFNCTMCRRESILILVEDFSNWMYLQVFDKDFDHWVDIDQSYQMRKKKLHVNEM